MFSLLQGGSAFDQIMLAREHEPCIAHAYDMINITESELEELVGEDAGSICKAEKRVICEDGSDTHGARMQCCFPAQAAQRGMAMHDVDLLSDYDVPEYGKEGEDSGQSSRAIDDPERHIVDFETIR